VTKLRVCPKCGYEESPIWRNTLRRLYTSHAHIEDLKIWEPELAKELIEKKYVYRNGVKYKLTKKGSHVHKIEAKFCQDPNPKSDKITEPTTEKCKSRILGRMKNQAKLLDDAFPERGSDKK